MSVTFPSISYALFYIRNDLTLISLHFRHLFPSQRQKIERERERVKAEQKSEKIKNPSETKESKE
jgi:hypothetical protein